MMAQYTALVSNILNNKYLASYVNFHKNYDCLNLITNDWESQLDNNIMYQDFSTHAKNLWTKAYPKSDYNYDKLNNCEFKVLVVGYCSFSKPYPGQKKKSVITIDSEPLIKITNAMTSDFGEQVKISNECKFSFSNCGGILGCDDCKSNAEKFSKAGYLINPTNQPCIECTQIFDGKQIVNRFLSQIESMFNQKFLAIMILNITNRYLYTNKNKENIRSISGTVSKIVGFHENKLLNPIKQIDVGHLVKIEYEQNQEFDEFSNFTSQNRKRKYEPKEKNEESCLKSFKFTEEENFNEEENYNEELDLSDLTSENVIKSNVQEINEFENILDEGKQYKTDFNYVEEELDLSGLKDEALENE